MHGTRSGEILHFDCLYVGDSDPLGKDGLDKGNRFKYILVVLDDLNNFVWLEPVQSCRTSSTAKHLLSWCKTFVVPNIWVNENALHYKIRVIKTLEGALRTENRFG